MYLIRVEHSFDSAHFLSNYEGKCGNIHGHRWRVEVEINARQLIENGKEQGMVADFTGIKKEVKKIVDNFDHALIIEQGSIRQETLNCLNQDEFKIVIVKFRTTAENFAYYFFNLFKEKNYNIMRVIVHETPTNSACYTEEQ